jgi:L-cysteine S-thiosulfotransferase
MNATKRLLLPALLLPCLWCVVAFGDDAQDARAREEINKYREMLQDGNPAELSEARGVELWATPTGPRHATLEQCDLGMGPGKVDGAYARLPRYFADTRQVQDVESRLVTCMMDLQGLTREQALRDWHKANSNMEALVTYVAGKSRGVKIEASMAQPEEQQMTAVGEALFFRRSGPLDFSCATCHSQPDKRIRLQEVRSLLAPADAQAILTQWPAYRLSQGQVWTMERRLIDCMRQMRWPEPQYLSEVVIALEAFLQKQANGGVMQAPGIKR